MKNEIHRLIHLLAEIQKLDDLQEKSHLQKKKLWNEVGEIMNGLVDD